MPNSALKKIHVFTKLSITKIFTFEIRAKRWKSMYLQCYNPSDCC